MQGGTLASIKREVEDRQNRRYAHMHQQKNLNHYSLHRKEIVAIQRWFRSRMVARTNRLKGQVMRALRNRQQLEEKNRGRKQELAELQIKRYELFENKENLMVEMMRDQMVDKLRRALNATLDCANRVAYNNSAAKFMGQQVQRNSQACHQLSGEIKALKLEEDCHVKRRKEWEDKIRRIEACVRAEKAKLRQAQQAMERNE